MILSTLSVLIEKFDQVHSGACPGGNINSKEGLSTVVMLWFVAHSGGHKGSCGSGKKKKTKERGSCRGGCKGKGPSKSYSQGCTRLILEQN